LRLLALTLRIIDPEVLKPDESNNERLKLMAVKMLWIFYDFICKENKKTRGKLSAAFGYDSMFWNSYVHGLPNCSLDYFHCSIPHKLNNAERRLKIFNEKILGKTGGFKTCLEIVMAEIGSCLIPKELGNFVYYINNVVYDELDKDLEGNKINDGKWQYPN
jgi:hypothetical protein